MASGRKMRLALLAAVTLAAVLAVWTLPPIAQNPAYHRFADIRAFLGLPNFLNVVTNGAFVLAGVFGLWRLPRMRGVPLQTAYLIMCVGALLIGIGSSWYHLAPSNATLGWDRAPMTIAFMALFSLVLGDAISARAGSRLLWPLIVTGLASVAYWQYSEMRGYGDLRPYALVQFLPMLLIPLVLALFRTTRLRAMLLWCALGAYALSKLAEHFDVAVFDLTGFISGHSVKHLLAAAAMLAAIMAYRVQTDVEHPVNHR